MSARLKVLKPEIVIVGAGVAGAPLSMALKRRGFDVLLVERLKAPKKIFKGEYLQPAAVKFLEPFNLDPLMPAGEWIRELRFRDVAADGEVISDLLMKYPDGLAARSTAHEDLLEALFQRAGEELGENFWRGAELSSMCNDGVEFCNQPRLLAKRAGQDDVILEPKWVIGCDGRNSTVRKWMGSKAAARQESVTWGSAAEWIVGMEIPTAAPHPQRYEVFRTFEKGTTCLFSLGGPKQRLYYSLPVNQQESENPVRVAPEAIRQAGEVMHENGFPALPADLPIARAYSAGTGWYGEPARGRVLLAGDALAVTTPFGGQGMTSACEHAEALLDFPWRENGFFALRRARQAYAKTARATFNRISLLNFGLYHLFFHRNAMLKAPTRYIVQTWQKDPALTNRVMRLFAGLDRDTPKVPELLKLWGANPAPHLRKFVPEFVREMGLEI